MKYRFNGKEPQIGKNNFIADTSSLIGDIVTGNNVTIWYSTVLRADCCSIKIGNNSNVQDNSSVHGDYEHSVIIGDNVTIGHNCVIHGCTIGNNVVIAMGSIILNGAKIPDRCIISAGAVVNEKLEIPEGSLIVGNPAKVLRPLSEKHIEYIEHAYKFYTGEIEKYKGLEVIR